MYFHGMYRFKFILQACGVIYMLCLAEPFSGLVYWEVVQSFLDMFTIFLIMEIYHDWNHIFRHVGRVVISEC
jgi:hypothetical protein